MATERQAPDAVLVSSGLTGAVGDIQDDPDAPDASWMVATGNNTATDVRTSFATPTGAPNVGTGLQEFKAWVRQFDEGQTGTPDVRIELWESAGLIRAGSNAAVPDGGLLVSFTWNANELSTADGSLVECKIVGVKTGGSPGVRNTVDVGAIEWNVDYSTTSAYSITGAVTVPPTIAATLLEGHTLAGSVAVPATVAAAMLEGRVLAGAVAIPPAVAATMAFSAGAAITGSVTVAPAVVATLLEGRTLSGTLTLTVSVVAGMGYSANYAVSGAVAMAPGVSAAMFRGRRLIGAAALLSTVTAVMLRGWTLSGDVPVTPLVASGLSTGVSGFVSEVVVGVTHLTVHDVIIGIGVQSEHEVRVGVSVMVDHEVLIGVS